MAYQMAPLSVTFSDVEGHFCCVKAFYLSHITLEIQHVLSTICLHMTRKAHAACNFSYPYENKGILKVTVSHIYKCKCGIISETVILMQTTNNK